tara:strand:- start:548 stop:901 length:354 start_codon:yes stop_codon:yes gene_type:complete
MRVSADRRSHFAKRITCGWRGLAGYRAVARRWRAVTGEISLIAKCQRPLEFAIVTQQFESQQIAAPTSHQCQDVRSSASLVLARYTAFSDYQSRFDLFIITYGKILPVGRIAHIKNA